MIPRYSRQVMTSIWTDEQKLKNMLEVEILAMEQMANEGKVPKSAVGIVRKKAKIDVCIDKGLNLGLPDAARSKGFNPDLESL